MSSSPLASTRGPAGGLRLFTYPAFLISPQRPRAHREENFCPFAGDAANGQFAPPPLAERDLWGSIYSVKELELSERFRSGVSLQAEAYLSFAGTSRQMKDLDFSVFSVSLW